MKIIYFTLFIILYILLRLLISFLFVKKENFNNLDYAIFEPSGNLAYHFGNKFKGAFQSIGKLNTFLNKVPQVEQGIFFSNANLNFTNQVKKNLISQKKYLNKLAKLNNMDLGQYLFSSLD